MKLWHVLQHIEIAIGSISLFDKALRIELVTAQYAHLRVYDPRERQSPYALRMEHPLTLLLPSGRRYPRCKNHSFNSRKYRLMFVLLTSYINIDILEL